MTIATEVVPTLFGEIEIFTSDNHTRGQLIEFGAHQKTDLELMLHCVSPGDRVLDLGAHVGTIAVPMGRKVGPGGLVAGVEASPDTFAILKRNFVRNGLDPSRLLNAVVAAREGRYEPNAAVSDMAHTGHLVWTLAGEGEGDGPSNSRSVAEILRDLDFDVNYIKIDIEGHDPAIVEALPFDRLRRLPVVSFECPSIKQFARALPLLAERGYRLITNIAPRDTGIFQCVPILFSDIPESAPLGLLDVFAIPPTFPLDRLLSITSRASQEQMLNLRVKDYAAARRVFDGISSPTVNDRAVNAEVLVRLRDWPAAESAFKDLVERMPGNPFVFEALARIQVNAGRGKEAVETIGRALALQPDNPAFKTTLALVHLSNGDLSGAEAAVDQACERFGNYTRGLLLQSRIKMKLGKFGDAGRSANQAAKSHKPKPAALIQIVKISIRQEKWARAEATLQRLLKADPESAEAQYLISQVFRGQGKSGAALESAQRARALAPSNVRFGRWLQNLEKESESSRSA